MDHDFSTEASLRDRALNLRRLHAHMAWLNQMLGDGHRFLLGDRASAADLSAYGTLWCARQNGGPTVEAGLPLGPLLGWMDRVAGLGHGTRRDMPAGVPADGDPSGLDRDRPEWKHSGRESPV